MLINIDSICGKDVSEGKLSVVESCSFIAPFDIKRIYYTYKVNAGITRGFHAHKELQQILICMYGKIEVTLDNGEGNVDTFILDSPEKGLYVGAQTWRTTKWLESDSVLLVLASEHYNESDYIRDYEEFIRWIKAKGDKNKNADTI